jgi:Na+/proline symporter
MGIILMGLIIVFVTVINLFPENISFKKAIEIASTNSKMEILNFSFDFENRYTVWSGIIGGTFLMMSYFGTDQSQVQRYLSGKSLREMQLGMIFNGILKIPMQFFILFIGIMVFVFYQFSASPLNFNPQAEKIVSQSSFSENYNSLKIDLKNNFEKKMFYYDKLLNSKNIETKNQIINLNKKEDELRKEGKSLIKKAGIEKNVKVETNDKDYIFISFILNNLPNGIIGLLLAVILSAAMSSTSSEINALATTSVVDILKRNFSYINDDNIVYYTKLMTFFWGICAITIASFAYLADNLIQLVNIIGSIFYGNVLGIFIIAFFFKKLKSNSVFFGAIITQLIIIYAWIFDWMPFLWLNVFGCFTVIFISNLINRFKLFSPLRN